MFKIDISILNRNDAVTKSLQRDVQTQLFFSDRKLEKKLSCKFLKLIILKIFCCLDLVKIF